MQNLLGQFLDAVRQPGIGVVVVAVAALVVAGMSIYGMILVIKKKW